MNGIGSFPMNLGSITSFKTGTRAGSTTAVQLPDIACNLVNIQAQSTNAGSVYIGNSSAVTVPGGTTNQTAGWELDAGQQTGWLPLSNLSQLWIIGDNAGDDIIYMLV